MPSFGIGVAIALSLPLTILMGIEKPIPSIPVAPILAVFIPITLRMF